MNPVRDGGITRDAIDVILHEARATREDSGERANDSHDRIDLGDQHEQRVAGPQCRSLP